MRDLFIDCGAWDGVSTQYFLNNNPGFQSIMFECMPDMFEAASKVVPNETLLKYAVWTEDTNLKFYLSEGDQPNGSTLYKSKRTGNVDKEHPMEVEAVDFSRFLLNDIPDAETIVVKMNIEGAEYNVIPHLIKTGAIRKIDYLFVDWHWGKIPSIKPKVHHKVYDELVATGIPFQDWNLVYGPEIPEEGPGSHTIYADSTRFETMQKILKQIKEKTQASSS